MVELRILDRNEFRKVKHLVILTADRPLQPGPRRAGGCRTDTRVFS